MWAVFYPQNTHTFWLDYDMTNFAAGKWEQIISTLGLHSAIHVG